MSCARHCNENHSDHSKVAAKNNLCSDSSINGSLRVNLSAHIFFGDIINRLVGANVNDDIFSQCEFSSFSFKMAIPHQGSLVTDY